MIWTNWDPLTDIIVSDIYTGPFQMDVEPSVAADFDTIRKETKEDLDNLASYLESLNVKVYRPKFERVPECPLVPARDQYFVYGDTIYNLYTSISNRYYDSLTHTETFKKFFKQGYNWISAPPPMKREPVPKWWKQGMSIYQNSPDLLWHGATMFRCGDSIIANVKGPGTKLGFEWMKKNLPKGTRIFDNNSPIYGSWGHIDHGWFMTDDNTVFCKSLDWLPPVLRDKNIIELKDEYELDKNIPNLIDTFTENKAEWINTYVSQWTGYDQVVHFHTNVLVVDSKNVIFSNEVPALFDAMDNMGIKCHAVNFRHSGFWEGGIHCMTNDLRRTGERRKIL
jgi:glycine amidinotransferase/scyllo-inosamine-4-phosphate amidinotransferase 1